MDYIIKYLYKVISISNEMAPYLLFGFLIAGILFVSFSPKKIYYYLGKKNITSVIKAIVTGMTCNHCKMNVENNLKNIKGIDNAVANLQSSTVQIRGKDFDLEKIKNTVEKLGYNYIEKR